MTRLPQALKEKATDLRSRGYSIKEIAKKLSISPSTSSLWLRGISLDDSAKKRLEERQMLSYYKTSEKWKQKRLERDRKYYIRATTVLQNTRKDMSHLKLYCALLFWCEGGKTEKTFLRFINSDPVLIKTFLTLLRKSFSIDESKLRALLHLHDYHNEKAQKDFWSRITKIDKKQFHKSYQKPHSGKRINKDYQGCVAITYYDVKIMREIKAIYAVFSEDITGV